MFAKQTGYVPLEPTVGMLIAVPCAVFGAFAVTGAAQGRDRLYLWLVSACLMIALLAGIPALGMNFSTMRFLADVTSAVLVLAAIGFWTLLAGARSAGRRRMVSGFGALLGLYTVLSSVLIGFQGGYYKSFDRVNPVLQEQLDEAFSVCE